MDAKQRTPRKKPRPKRRPGEDAKKLVRSAQALDLRTTGATYREIGASLGVSEKTAYYDVQDELARLDPVVTAKAERLRDLEARRLDRYTRMLEPGILDGDPRAILAAVRLMERRAKLLGLDAPTTITAPAGEALPVRIVMQHEVV
jgi:DNA-binding CsgD family transcriptional regulator